MITSRASADATSVAAHYDELDDLYRSIWGNHIHHGCWITGKETTEQAVLNLTHLIAREAQLKPGDRVCDIGCGYGASALVFARQYEAEVLGLTVSKKQYEIAKAGSVATAKVDFLLLDGLNNLLPAESFDTVVSIESSEHMQDKSKFFAEAFRLLRPGGRLAVAAWLTCKCPNYWESKYLLEPICAEGRLPSLASASEYQTMLAQSGFSEIKYHDLTRQVRQTWSVCALRLLHKILREPGLRQRLLDPEFPNRVFAKTVFRIWLAYKTASMCYGIFAARKSVQGIRVPGS
jgi:cyclopropane fatty-acyl-phospholipid synthase-like methyltransferase